MPKDCLRGLCFCNSGCSFAVLAYQIGTGPKILHDIGVDDHNVRTESDGGHCEQFYGSVAIAPKRLAPELSRSEPVCMRVYTISQCSSRSLTKAFATKSGVIICAFRELQARICSS